MGRAELHLHTAGDLIRSDLARDLKMADSLRKRTRSTSVLGFRARSTAGGAFAASIGTRRPSFLPIPLAAAPTQ